MANTRNLLRRYKFVLSRNPTGTTGDFGGFTSISGLEIAVSTTRYREGQDENLHGATIVGRSVASPIELTRGCLAFGSPETRDLLQQALQNMQDNVMDDEALSSFLGDSNGMIYLKVMGKKNTINRVYAIENPCIVRSALSTLDASDTGEDILLMENLTLQHSGITLLSSSIG